MSQEGLVKGRYTGRMILRSPEKGEHSCLQGPWVAVTQCLSGKESCCPRGPERKTALASAWLRGIALYLPDTHEIAEMETLLLSRLRKALLSSSPSPSAPAAAVVPTVQHGPDKLCRLLPALGDSSTPIWRENFCPVL